MVRIFTLLLISCLISACDTQPTQEIAEPEIRPIEERFGTKFTKVRPAHFKPPVFSELAALVDDGAQASWGASGRDDAGNIYFGFSGISDNLNNSYLYQYQPKSNQLIFQGDTLSQLKNSGLYKEGVGQNKLHSKIYQADDGYIYFATFDEEGESVSREKFPIYGGHLWRKKPDDKNWEHLLATKEALIALNSDGRYIYALGYWGHVLYQYDTLSRRFNRATIGSIKGHVSRNLVVSGNGHVFVPKTIERLDGDNIAELIEFDSQLNIVAQHGMEHYFSSSRYTDHGISSFSNLRNGDVYFATGAGALYKIERQENNINKVTFKAFLNQDPERNAYVPAMFSIDGADFLAALGKAPKDEVYSWFIYEASTGTMVSYPLADIKKDYLLYGSATRDKDGNLYISGVDYSESGNYKAMLYRLNYPE